MSRCCSTFAPSPWSLPWARSPMIDLPNGRSRAPVSGPRMRISSSSRWPACWQPRSFMVWFRNARRIGTALALRVLPPGPAKAPDLGAAPRRTIVVALQLAVVLAAGIPLVAFTQPFLPLGAGVAVLAVIVLLLGILFWRSAAHLGGHVRASSVALFELITRKGEDTPSVEDMLPGLADVGTVRVEPHWHAAGHTLGDLDVHALTGATILAVQRDGATIVTPGAGERLVDEDLLAIVGTEQSRQAALVFLQRGPERSRADDCSLEEAAGASQKRLAPLTLSMRSVILRSGGSGIRRHGAG